MPKRAVIAALDRGTREREMAAQLLAHLRARDVLSRAECEAGFDLLLQELESLAIDVPAAPDELSHFLARAAVDDVISETSSTSASTPRVSTMPLDASR